jgi:hypothetical protein
MNAAIPSDRYWRRQKWETDAADHAIGFSSNNRATIAESR